MFDTCVATAGTILLADAAVMVGLRIYRALRRLFRTPTHTARRDSPWHRALTVMYGI